MSAVFRMRRSRIPVIGLALGLLFVRCQNPTPQSSPEGPEPPDQELPQIQAPDAVPNIPVKSIAEIATDMERDAGFVLKGAYVLDSKPNRLVDDRWTHGTVGYLPVGEIVFLDRCATEITVYRPATNPLASPVATEEQETYCAVTTPSGFEGLVRSDRVALLQNPVAIATGSAELKVFDENADPPISESIGTFSRSHGTYVEILGESTEYLRVRMPWSVPGGIVGLLRRDPSSYFIVDEATQVAVPVSFESAVQNVTDRIEAISGFPLNQIISGVSNASKRVADIGNLSALMCRLDVNAFAEIGFSAFGSGGGMNAQLQLWKSGTSHDYDLDVMQVGGERLRTLAMVKRLKCIGSEPDRMDAFWIYGEPTKTSENVLFLLHDGGEDDSPVRQGGRQAMFTIDGDDAHYDSQRIQRELQNAARDNVWLDAVTAWERKIVLDYILRKVTFVSSSAR